MACFLVPAAEKIVATIATQVAKTNKIGVKKTTSPLQYPVTVCMDGVVYVNLENYYSSLLSVFSVV